MLDENIEWIKCLEWLSERPEFGVLRWLFKEKDQFLWAYRNCMKEKGC